LLFFSFSVHC